jgi:hypothetical protein
MIRSLFGADTNVSMVRGGLQETSATQRGIGERVAAATGERDRRFRLPSRHMLPRRASSPWLIR